MSVTVAGVRREARSSHSKTGLRFATVTVDQSCCRTSREPNLRTALERVTVLGRRRDRAGCYESVERAAVTLPSMVRNSNLLKRRGRNAENECAAHSGPTLDPSLDPR